MLNLQLHQQVPFFVSGALLFIGNFTFLVGVAVFLMAAATTIAAMGLAFDTSALSFPADTGVTLTLDNQDAGVPHNVAIYAGPTDLATPLFRGDLVTGPMVIDYTIPALTAGTYYFQCDVHPTMNGTVTVA